MLRSEDTLPERRGILCGDRSDGLSAEATEEPEVHVAAEECDRRENMEDEREGGGRIEKDPMLRLC